MKVMKFGGTSLGMPQRMHHVAGLITGDPEEKIIVLSAISGTTNALSEISTMLSHGRRDAARQKIDELEQHYRNFTGELLNTSPGRAIGNAVVDEHFDFLSIILRISYSEALSRDILAQGELLSSRLFSACLQEREIEHMLLPALDFMSVDADGEPRVEAIREKLKPMISSHDTRLFITQGYICRNARGEVDNLKRGGSDYSASLIAAAMQADICEIWTDISGMRNNDPRVVEETLPVQRLSFDEAAELAYFGAKILHPASIWPARYWQIPVRLLNTMEPDDAGTLISGEAEQAGVKAVAAKDGITAINIRSSRMLLAYGFLRRIFEVFEKYRTSIDMITTSEVAVSLTIDNDYNLQPVLGELEQFSSVTVDPGQSIICIVGHRVASSGGVLQQVFDSLQDIQIRMVSYGGSEHNISLLVDSGQKSRVLKLLNRGLFGLS